jgi:raffinose/stachyose/melibiose transport system substrate-binding protein
MGTEPLSRRSFLAAAGLTGLSIPLLGACGGDSDDSDSGGSGGSSKKVTLEWWNIATTEPGKSLFPQIANAFMAANPNVTIKTTVLENEAFKAKMTAQTSSGKLPDIFHTWGGGVLKQQIDAGLVQDLTSKASSWATSTLTATSLNAYQFDGKLYAIPFDIGMVGFWYNKKLFAKAGITAPPATWSAFLDAVKKLKAAGTTPIALAGKDKWPGMYYWAYLALRIGGLPALQQAQAGNDFNGPAFVQAGQHLKELSDLAPFQQGYQGAAYDAPGGQAATMGSGKAGMELMGQWGPAVEKAAGKGIGSDLGFFPFPTVEGGQGKVTEVFGGGAGHALRKGAPDAALDFLKFFVNAENEHKLIASNGYLPVVKGAENQITDPNRKIVASTVASATGFQLFLDQAFPPAVGQEVNDSVIDLIAGKKTPEQVTQQITKTAKSQ